MLCVVMTRSIFYWIIYILKFYRTPIIGNIVEGDDVSKQYTIEDSVKHGLVNLIPESGMWFCVVKKAKGSHQITPPLKETLIPNQSDVLSEWFGI